MVGADGGELLIDLAERIALLILRRLPGAGDRTLVAALRDCGSARAVLDLNPRRFANALGKAAERVRHSTTLRAEAEQTLDACERMRIGILNFGGEGYPDSLRALADPPAVLFLRGDRALLDRPRVAIVGSRRATGVGRRTAERIAGELSDRGVAVVSGLAYGIDAAAHRGAVGGRGGTVAVLGSGPDRAQPTGNRTLFQAIAERGLIVSEFAPGEPARPYHFPRRNRVLAALSSGVVVVEAATKSGALITVDHALDLGLDVFAVPGSVEVAQSNGTNALIRDGAHVVTRGRDILEVLGWNDVLEPAGSGSVPDRGPPARDGIDDVGPTRERDEVRFRVLESLGSVPASVDELVLKLDLPVSRLLAALTRLELDGSAIHDGEGWRRRGIVRTAVVAYAGSLG